MKRVILSTLALCLTITVSATEGLKSRIIEEGGTGAYKAIMTEVEGLKEHTVFCPQDLSQFNAEHPMPVLVWGNGACANSPWEHMNFLNEIASHGYLVLATGNIPMTDEWYKGPMSRSEQQIESIDWAFAQNADPQSPYYQKIDVKNICVSGMSCGGLQTLFNCADSRIKTLMICNSGLFNQQNAGQAVGGMPMPPKEKLKEIHTPIIYILGGKEDIAYENGMDDFHRIDHVPAFAANFPVGHGGTYREPHGGEFTIVALAWLDWQLKNDQEAAKMFVGDDCGLLKRKDWTLEKKQPKVDFGGFQLPQAQLETSQVWKDVNYAGDGQAYHTCDIYLPKKEQASYPVVIHIYGSAWFSNSSKGAADLGTIVKSLLDAGYAVVCPNHRSSMDAKWPAQINDIRAVIRFVRGEAEKYKFDTSFIATSGFSSGGHLASTAATTSGTKQTKVGTVDIDLEGAIGSYTNESSAVNAACDWSGPIDLTAMDCGESMKMGENSPEDVLLNSKLDKEPDKYLSLSATTYVDKNDPPVIIFHGEKDNVVPCCQGKMFFEVLKAAGVKTEATFVLEGGHGIGMYSEENLQKMVDFLNSIRFKPHF